jgi:hypothetical protein
MAAAEASGASGAPPRRSCAVCGGAMRRSHVAYLGGNREAVVHRCEVCGVTSQGPAQERAPRAAAGRESRRRRPLPDGGAPDNPVIDGDLARLLRERFGDGGSE